MAFFYFLLFLSLSFSLSLPSGDKSDAFLRIACLRPKPLFNTRSPICTAYLAKMHTSSMAPSVTTTTFTHSTTTSSSTRIFTTPSLSTLKNISSHSKSITALAKAAISITTSLTTLYLAAVSWLRIKRKWVLRRAFSLGLVSGATSGELEANSVPLRVRPETI